MILYFCNNFFKELPFGAILILKLKNKAVMKGKIVSFILLAFISITPAYGQTTIKGTIVDSQQVGIPYAAVKGLKRGSFPSNTASPSNDIVESDAVWS